MLIKIKVFPCYKEEKIEELSKDTLRIFIKERPVQGLANKKMMEMLKEYFGTGDIKIIKGFRQSNKIIEINGKTN